MSDTEAAGTKAAAVYDPNAIFDENGPIDPWFVADAVQALMRAHHLRSPEKQAAQQRHYQCALIAVGATHPRDPIEVLISVQALSAYQAACACWRIGMNSDDPGKDRIRHISAAATAARTFDTMLRALERRQAKPLAVPVGRPEARTWAEGGREDAVNGIAERIYRADAVAVAVAKRARAPKPAVDPAFTWSAADLAVADAMMERERIAKENEGLDIANTEGILPGGGMILPEDATPQQEAYMARRLKLMYQREYEENLRNGIKKYPKIRGIRPGDLIP
jgi:hypothetical protein